MYQVIQTPKTTHHTLIPLTVLTLLTISSALILSSHHTIAESTTTGADVNVASACTLSGTINSAHAATTTAGSYTEDIGTTTLKTICNDDNGFAIYAIGFTNNELGNTVLLNNSDSDTSTNHIITRANTTGDTSNWAMKLSTFGTTYLPTITNGFNAYHTVPDTYTKVAEYGSNTDSTTGSNLTTTYSAYIAQNQKPGTYVGQVKYTMIHPKSTAAYMQDVNAEYLAFYLPNSGDTMTLYDRRDSNDYKIANIHGKYYMVQNLRLTGVVSAAGSNFNTLSTMNLSSSDFESANGVYHKPESHVANATDVAASGNIYTTSQLGIWYNFCAATAGTVCSQASVSSAEDICPSGWRLPTYQEYLSFDYDEESTETYDYTELFEPIYGGYYAAKKLQHPTDRSVWWSSTNRGSGIQRTLSYSGDEEENYKLATNVHSRTYGAHIRCIFNS